jgi:hypothetical protein
VVAGAEQGQLRVGVGAAEGGERGLGDDVVAEAVRAEYRDPPDVRDQGSGLSRQAQGGAAGGRRSGA